VDVQVSFPEGSEPEVPETTPGRQPWLPIFAESFKRMKLVICNFMRDQCDPGTVHSAHLLLPESAPSTAGLLGDTSPAAGGSASNSGESTAEPSGDALRSFDNSTVVCTHAASSLAPTFPGEGFQSTLELERIPSQSSVHKLGAPEAPEGPTPKSARSAAGLPVGTSKPAEPSTFGSAATIVGPLAGALQALNLAEPELATGTGSGAVDRVLVENPPNPATRVESLGPSKPGLATATGALPVEGISIASPVRTQEEQTSSAEPFPTGPQPFGKDRNLDTPKRAKRRYACAHCGKKGGCEELKECSRCGTVKYCSRKCAEDHWARHRAACKAARARAKAAAPG
jgi:MYND finger